MYYNFTLSIRLKEREVKAAIIIEMSGKIRRRQVFNRIGKLDIFVHLFYEY